MLSTDLGTMLLEALYDGACLADRDGQLLALNTGMGRLLGVGAGGQRSLLGRPLASLFEEFSSDLASEILRLTLEEGHWHGDVLFVRPDTRAPLPVYLVASRLPDPLAAGGGEARYLVLALDYSEQHYAISDRIRRQTILQRLLSSAPLAIVVIDEEQRIAERNESARLLWERIGATLALGQSLAQALAPLDATFQTLIDRAIAGEAAKESDVRLTAAQPEPIVTVEVIPSGRRHERTLLLFLEDRTEAIKAESRLRETERFASLGLLAANMAHEINNPLQGLQGALERLDRRGKTLTADDPVQLESAQRDIGESVTRCLEVLDRMRRIIAPVLDLARPHPPQVAQIDLGMELKKQIAFFQLDPTLAGITFSLSYPEDLPRVATDAAQMGQLLTNVVLNAAHAMAGEGTVQLSVRMEGEQVLVEVRDSGPGVREADAPHLFTPFFTTKPVGKGTGLGLYLSRSIAQRLGGWLEFVPDAGPGALFRLTLPREYGSDAVSDTPLMRRGIDGTIEG